MPDNNLLESKDIPDLDAKYDQVVDCGRNKEKALKLTKEGCKVKLDLSYDKNITDVSDLAKYTL